MKKVLMLVAVVGLGLSMIGCAGEKPASPPPTGTEKTMDKPAEAATTTAPDAVAAPAAEEKK